MVGVKMFLAGADGVNPEEVGGQTWPPFNVVLVSPVN